ncbi:hypothetical protein [Flavobacterium akiainvivens]|nr:hypothetical protein [Flavobacterium akiainvivens]SFQ59737.1 hypothetical protein SAMN05444144_109128 [Flavobacterium akiainvivens]
MDFILNNVKKEDLPVLKALAKRLDFEIEIIETESKSVETDN